MAVTSPSGSSTRAEILLHARGLLSVRVPANVWFLGLTSCITDISSEMLVSSLPGYLMLHLGLGPLAFGFVDGLYHGLTSIARIASGVLADRSKRYKDVAFVGYALSAACKALFILSTTGPAIGAVIAADRLGKGIRTAPRDAMIGLSVSQAELAGAFGVHRALDTAGAALGPVVAFAVLAASRQAYDAVFLASFALALIGLAVLGLFVRNPGTQDPPSSTQHAEGGTQHATVRHVLSVPGFTTLMLAAVPLALVTVSDGFLYLVLQRELGLNPVLLPLLFAGTALCFFVMAVPLGRLADRVGRATVFVVGYALLLVAYLLVLAPLPAALRIGALLLVLGGYYAATDGVLAALASERLPREVRGAGLAVLATGTTIARFCGSLMFGYLWSEVAASQVILFFAMALLLALLYGAARLRDVVPRSLP